MNAGYEFNVPLFLFEFIITLIIINYALTGFWVVYEQKQKYFHIDLDYLHNAPSY